MLKVFCLCDMLKSTIAFLLKSSSISAKRGPAFFLPSRPLATRASKHASANSQDAEVGALSETSMGASGTRKKAPRLKIVKVYSDQGLRDAEGSLHAQISTVKAEARAEEAKVTAEDLGACCAAVEEATQLQIIESENVTVRENEAVEKACAPTHSVQEDLSEIIAELDLDSYKYGKRWVETAHKLRDYGIPLTHIAAMLKKCRKLPCSRVWVDSTMKNFALLGMSHEEMGRTISKWPTILNVTDSMFRSKIEFFESIGIDRHHLGKNASITVVAISLSLSILQQNAAFWNDYMKDVQANAVCSMMLSNPQLLSYKSYQEKVAWLEAQAFDKRWFLKGSPILSRSLPMLISKAELLERFGVSDVRTRTWALKNLARIRIPKLQARFDNLLSAGFSLDQVRGIISKAPSVLSLTEENVRTKIDYVLNAMDVSLDTLASSKCVWYHSLERRIKYRHEVIRRLRSLGALRQDLGLDYMICMRDAGFHRRFVETLEDVVKQADTLSA